jgi:SAM-dependent methyltransferase
MSHEVIADDAAARTLGRVLRDVGYTDDAVYRLLGDDAYSNERNDSRVEARRLPETPLATIVRAFFLQLPASREDALQALGPSGIDAVETIGLADVSDGFTPHARILPVGDVLLASDGFSQDERDPADYVATYTPTARVLDSLTPRLPVIRALDLGTGGGIQAVLAARHAREVIATDVNPRALLYTRINAALNDLSNIECRQGSLFEPVQGETFDLITCNAPYVVSPDRRWAYRDSGFQADQLSERVVREAAPHLADGGFAALQVSWLAPDEETADDRVLAWLAETDCDAWILPTLASDPLTHASEWNAHLTYDAAAMDDALERWTSYFDDLGVGWVSEGVVVLRRRHGTTHTVRVDPVDDDDLDDAGDQIVRAFETRARLEEIDGDDGLLDQHVSLAMALKTEEEIEPDDETPAITGARVVLGEGTKHVVETTTDSLWVLTTLDSSLPLGEFLEYAAERLDLSEDELEEVEREASETIRELLELGALEIRKDS